jgi:hypothetical protein
MSWTSRPRAWTLAALALASAPAAARAQGWHERQLWAAALGSRPAVYGAGFGLAWRDVGRTRVGAALLAGATGEGRGAARLEATWHFQLDPARQHGFAVYGGGGLALAWVDGGTVTPWVQAVLGAETGPAARTGFFVEAGFGGGARLAAGVRWRKHNAPNR